MAGKKVTVEIDESELADIMRKLAVAKAEVRKLNLMVEHYAKEHGGFSMSGLHIFNTQTMSQTFDATLVSEVLDELRARWRDVSPWLPRTVIDNLVLKSDLGKDIRAILKKHPSEGMVTSYGKARLAVRTSAPDEAKVHIVNLGEEPLTTSPLEEEQYDDSDDEYVSDAPLSPGA
jgi:hypothetical protein